MPRDVAYPNLDSLYKSYFRPEKSSWSLSTRDVLQRRSSRLSNIFNNIPNCLNESFELDKSNSEINNLKTEENWPVFRSEANLLVLTFECDKFANNNEDSRSIAEIIENSRISW